MIKAVTIPTVLKNLELSRISEVSCKYFYGDWMSFSGLIERK